MADLFSKHKRRDVDAEQVYQKLRSQQVNNMGASWPLCCVDLITGDVIIERVMCRTDVWREALRLTHVLALKGYTAWITLERANAKLSYYTKRKKQYLRQPPSYGIDAFSHRLTTRHPIGVVGFNKTLHISDAAWRSWLYMGLCDVLDIAWASRVYSLSSLHAMDQALALLRKDLQEDARPRQRKIHDRNGDLGSSLELRIEEMFLNVCELAMGDSDTKLHNATTALIRLATNISDQATLCTFLCAHHGRLAGFLWGAIEPITAPLCREPSAFKGWFTDIVPSPTRKPCCNSTTISPNDTLHHASTGSQCTPKRLQRVTTSEHCVVLSSHT